MKNFWNDAICILTIASMVGFPFPSALGAAPAKPPGTDDIEELIDNLGRKADGLRAALKRERFDPEARVEHADYDLETLVNFVRDEIAFHPYAGTLRGAAGTLRARAGSSLDQALLLAQMTRTAGFDARIVRADLNDEQARRLLDASGNAPRLESLDYMSEAIKQAFGESEKERSATRRIEETRYYKDTQRHAQVLLRTLDDAGIKMAPMDATEQLLSKIRSYFWVQYRESSSGPWEQAHPAFGSTAPLATLKPAEFFSDSVPAKYQHQFTMTAWIEQWLGGKIEKRRITEPWSAPVANLNGEAIRFQNVPDGVTRDNANDLDQALANTNTLMPFVGKAPASGSMAFDLQGRTIDPMAQGGSPAASIFKTVGDKFVSAATELADRTDGKPAMALHSMYLEFTFQRPGGESETRRRYLLLPRETYDEDRSEVLRQLITGYTYMVGTGDQPREFITDRFIDGTVSDLEWLQYMVLSWAPPEQKMELPDEPLSAFPTLFQQWKMERLPVDKGVVRFRGQPALVGIRDGFRDARTTFSEVDVVWNAVESVRRSGNLWFTVPQDSLNAGVWDTVLESIPSNGAQASAFSVASAPILFDLAQEQDIELLVLDPDQPSGAQLEEISLDRHEKQFLQRDLDAGYAVVIPARKPDRSPMAAWWRVNTDSGETLGMMGDGYGATLTEYAVITGTVALGGALIVAKFNSEVAECQEEEPSKSSLCCAVDKFWTAVNDEAQDDEVRDRVLERLHNQLCGD
jgi:hypothetical protein